MSEYIAPGDKNALKAYLAENGRAIYGRALALTGSDEAARTATRYTMEAVVRAFELGLLDTDSEWLMELTKRCTDSERIKHKGIDSVVESMRVIRNIEQYGPLVSDDERDKRVNAALSRATGLGVPPEEQSPIRPEPKPYAQPEPYAQPKPHAQPEPYAQPKPYAQPEPYAQPKPHAQPEPYVQPEPKPPAQPETAPLAWPEAESRMRPQAPASRVAPARVPRFADDDDVPTAAKPLHYAEASASQRAVGYGYDEDNADEAYDEYEQAEEAGAIDLFAEDDDGDGESVTQEPPRRRKKRRERGEAGIATVLMIFALMFVVAFLTWMLVVMLMTRGILPLNDFGFAEWFNANLFKLY